MKNHYDDISSHYDRLVEQDIDQESFPYAGYQLIEDLLIDDLNDQKKKITILDLGCGTGKLYEHLSPDRFSLVGIDESKNMLEIARKRYPKASFYQYDLLRGLPHAIKHQKFDYIIANYLFMHFSFQTTIDMINELVKHLNHGGKIVIGDLLFINGQARQDFFYQHQEYVGLDFYFHLYSDYVNQMSEQLALSYFEINEYTGMMIIENINEFTLLFEDPLVKYKSNTEKWRSTHPQRKRE